MDAHGAGVPRVAPLEAHRVPALPQSFGAVRPFAFVPVPDPSKVPIARGGQAGAPGRALDECRAPGDCGRDEPDHRHQSVPADSTSRDDDDRSGGPLAVLRAASVRRSVLGKTEGLGLRGSGPQWELLLQAAQDPAVVLGQHRLPSRSPSEPRIPNYNLEKCHQADPLFQSVKPITLLSSLRSFTYRLWDEQRGKLVGYRHLRELRRQQVRP